jgi:hypothetical protein
MNFSYIKLDVDLTENFRKIIEDIVVHESPIDITGKSTQNGIQYELSESKNIEKMSPIISKVEEEIYSKLGIKHLKVCSAWTVLGRKGTYHTCHKHNTNDDISTVLYLETPIFNPPHGSFYFFDDGEVWDFHPQKGDLIIFPVTTFHGTYPQGRGLRQTLNLNFSRK